LSLQDILCNASHITLEDVLVQFLKSESHHIAGLSGEIQQQIANCLSGEGSDAVAATRAYFGPSASDDSPVYARLLGTRSCKNYDYQHAELPIESLFTFGVNPKINLALESFRWNIKEFALQAAHCFPDEFPNGGSVPQGELRNLITVVASDNRIRGAEVIDGFHRAVALILAGERSIPSFVVRSNE